MLECRSEKLLKIFRKFDFGYDVDLICSDEWAQASENEYTKKVYLECVENSRRYTYELYVKFIDSSAQEQEVYCCCPKGDRFGSYPSK